jgi:hypothetical protein
MVNILNHPGANNRPVEAAVLRRQSYPISASLPILSSGYFAFARHTLPGGVGSEVRWPQWPALRTTTTDPQGTAHSRYSVTCQLKCGVPRHAGSASGIMFCVVQSAWMTLIYEVSDHLEFKISVSLYHWELGLCSYDTYDWELPKE